MHGYNVIKHSTKIVKFMALMSGVQVLGWGKHCHIVIKVLKELLDGGVV